jgi:hypothetical protein
VDGVSYDSSRFTFDPRNDFDGVVMEQGRPLLDSDWNEWLEELRRRNQAQILDIIGPAGYPASTPHAFEIIVPANPAGKNTFSIGVGRMYVDGLLAENHGSTDRKVVVWDHSLSEELGANTAPIDYLQQPYQPYLTNANLPQGQGPYVVYLDVWRREITHLEHPEIIEPALGVDTTGRWQTVWQVKLLDVGQPADAVDCNSGIPAWDDLINPAAERLTTGQVASTASGPCCLTANTGYTGKENQLYRVEIQQPGAAMASPNAPVAFPLDSKIATFKWSRDNASVATNVSAITAVNVSGKASSRLTVHSTGKDDVLRFSANDWVEITDDWRELQGLPGELRQVVGVDDSSKTVTVSPQISATKFLDGAGQVNPMRHTRLIRWDQKGLVLEGDGKTVWANLDDPNSTGEIAVPPPGMSLILEGGITVTFDGGSFRSGNFWCFTARSTDGSVEKLDHAPPRGIHHHYTRLSVVNFGNAQVPSTATDCRTPFSPITRDKGIHVVQVYRVSPEGVRTTLLHDSSITLDEFLGGIDIECDQIIDPKSVSRPSCFVSIEVPLSIPTNPLRTFPSFTLITLPFGLPARQVINLDATVDVDPTGKFIRWRPAGITNTLLKIIGPKELSEERGILTRLTLLGNFIWSSLDASTYLDGDSFERGVSGVQPVPPGLRFPSGDGRSGGTFSMWFWLALLRGVTVSTKAPFTPGKILDCQVDVTSPPVGSSVYTVKLTAEGPSISGVTINPPTVEIRAGTSARFQVATANASGQFLIVASLGTDQQACGVKIGG